MDVSYNTSHKKTLYEFIEPKRRCKEDESEEISRANATLHGQRIERKKGVKGTKKSGVGLNKRAAVEEGESSSSSNDDSDSIASVQPRKKSRGTTDGRMSGRTRSVGVSRVAKVVKGTKSSTVQVLRRHSVLMDQVYGIKRD